MALFAVTALAAPRAPLPPWPEQALNSWRFDDQGSWGGPLSPPWVLQGIEATEGWSGYALRIGSSRPGMARFPAFQTDGRPNLTLSTGTVRLWFAPEWASVGAGGKGPGLFARLIDVGRASANGEGWWSLYFDPEGSALHFSAQAGGVGADYLQAPIAWSAGQWHQVALVYGEKFSALYVDGVLAAEGQGVAVWPEEAVLAASGFCVGGDAGGTALAHGQFDELTTFGYPCSAEELAMNFRVTAAQAVLGPVSATEIAARRARRPLTTSAGAREMKGGGEEDGGGTMMMRSTPAAPESPCGTNGLCLSIQQVDQFAVITLHNTQPGTNYIVESKAELPGTTWTFEQSLVGRDGTNLTQTVFPITSTARFFRARTVAPVEPRLHINEVREPVLPEPYVQVFGYSETPLLFVQCRVMVDGTNFSEARGYVTEQYYDGS